MAFVTALALVVVVLAANAVFLLGVRTKDPLVYTSGLARPAQGFFPGAVTIDPNVGWTVQALGREAARQWAAGHLPLWNLYEGLGQPLAGEMQSAAFFLPFVLFHLFPNGIAMMHVALEVIAGLAMLGLLRQLGLSWLAAWSGGCLFALNGVFSVMTNAPFHPVAFLPLALWGVEIILTGAACGRRSRVGTAMTAVAVAEMFYAGFPETAFLQGIFVACWALARSFRPHRAWGRTALTHVAIAGVLGCVIAAPVLVSFAAFMGFATAGYHGGADQPVSYPLDQITSLVLPYAAGPLGNPVFGVQAGYLTVPLVLLGAVGWAGPRSRVFRIASAAVFTVLVTNMFGFPPVAWFFRSVPVLNTVIVYKYGILFLIFLAVLCAAFGLDDLLRRRARPRVVGGALGVLAFYGVASVAYVVHNGLVADGGWSVLYLAVTSCLTLALTFALIRSRPGSWARTAAAGVLVLDGVLTFAVPQATASPSVPVDASPVDYLRSHLGTARFYTLGPIQPNYGSYWGIQQFNVNDLPIAKKYSDLLVHQLTPKPGTRGARGTERSFESFQLVPFNPKPVVQRSLLDAYGQAQQHFRDAGVAYLVMAPGVGDGAGARSLGLRKVFTSRTAEIWHDAKAKHYYTTMDGACAVRKQSLTDVTLECSTPATLQRLQLSSPGWTATVNGQEQNMSGDARQLYQHVSVPQGRSTVSFSYEPRFFKLAVGVSLVTLLAVVLDAVVGTRSGRRRRGLRSGRA